MGAREVLIALILGLLPALGHAQVADHLKCYAIKDPLLSNSPTPVKTYTADLNGLAPEPGCVIKMPAKYLCVETTKANVQPPPPGGPAGSDADRIPTRLAAPASRARSCG
jgi:hypothetical protein